MEFLIIGEIINTHGIKGELKILPMTHDVKRFKKLETVYLGKDREKAKVKKAREHKNAVIIELEEYSNINEVLKYKGDYLYIDINDRLELPEDNYYIYELIGLKCYDLEDSYLGEIIDVLQAYQDDIYVIKNGDHKEFMVPAVKEFIKNIDIENGIVLIDPIEGMIE